MIDRDDREPVEREEDQGQEEEVQDTSVRGALRAAIKEHSDDEQGEEQPAKEPAKKPVEDKGDKDEIARRLEKARQAKADKSVAKRGGVLDNAPRDNLAKETKKEEKTDEKSVEAQTAKHEPPPFWKSKGKEVWDTLSPAAQEAVVKREKEVSDGFAQYGEKTRAFDALAKVIEPHMPAIQRYGVTVPQTIERLFGWMNALSHNDENARANAFKSLAQSFNVNLARLVPQQAAEGQEASQTDSTQPPPWFQQYATQINQKLGTVEMTAHQLAEQNRVQTESAANGWLNNWAKDKPHFTKVRTGMKYLLENGYLPATLEDGTINLDGAYEMAVSMHPEVQAQIKQEAEAKAKADADDKARKDAADSAARLVKARRAGSSLRPAAPTIASVPSQHKPNGAGRQESVRESLVKSMQQLANSE